jgi:hypothetical protein
LSENKKTFDIKFKIFTESRTGNRKRESLWKIGNTNKELERWFKKKER